MKEENTLIAVFQSHEQAENAIRLLKVANIDVKSISIIGKDYHTEEKVHGYYNIGDRVKFWGKNGAFWGSLWGVLFGAAFLFIPGIGPIAAAGPLVQTLIGAVEGAIVIGGVSALGAALYSIGIPKDSIIQYETALKADKFVVIIHGDAAIQVKDIQALDAAEGVESIEMNFAD